VELEESLSTSAAVPYPEKWGKLILCRGRQYRILREGLDVTVEVKRFWGWSTLGKVHYPEDGEKLVTDHADGLPVIRYRVTQSLELALTGAPSWLAEQQVFLFFWDRISTKPFETEKQAIDQCFAHKRMVREGFLYRREQKVRDAKLRQDLRIAKRDANKTNNPSKRSFTL
jgi:hypothetical protein